MRIHDTSIALPLVAVFAALIACTAAEDEAPDAAGRETAGPLAALMERSDYAKLDERSVVALARAAETRWPQEFLSFTYERTERFSAGGASHWISVWTHGKTGLEFVLVPGGTFQMGSPATEAGRGDDEVQNRVSLDPFLISRTECTQAAWAELATAADLDGDPSFFEGSNQFPVERVSSGDADAWCRAARLTLPTEAQWEFACRGGTTTAWAMGADKSDLRRFANLGSAECPKVWIDHEMVLTEPWLDGYGNQIASVGSFDANAFGLLDVHGNVREWCRDDDSGYGVEVEKGTGMRRGTAAWRVVRGGSFNAAAGLARSARRTSGGPGLRARFVGFRPSLDLPL